LSDEAEVARDSLFKRMARIAKVGKRMATGGPFSPLRHPAPGIVEELAETRREILHWVELAEGRDLNLRVFRSPAPLVRMGFAEWLTLHARHAEYHADVMELFDPFCAG
jgi:hypothetical protein